MADARPTAAATSSRLFQAMTASEREAVLGAAAHRSLHKGQVLIRQGEPASTFFLMERGYLKLTQLTPDGAEVIVRFVGPGDPVAGVAALGEAPYPVTAAACDAVDALAWSRGQLADLLARYPQLKTNILREMTAHMDDALTRLRELATLDVRQRLAHTLLRLTVKAAAGERGVGGPAHADPPGAGRADRHDALHGEPDPHRVGGRRPRPLDPRPRRRARRRAAAGCRRGRVVAPLRPVH